MQQRLYRPMQYLSTSHSLDGATRQSEARAMASKNKMNSVFPTSLHPCIGRSAAESSSPHRKLRARSGAGPSPGPAVTRGGCHVAAPFQFGTPGFVWQGRHGARDGLDQGHALDFPTSPAVPPARASRRSACTARSACRRGCAHRPRPDPRVCASARTAARPRPAKPGCKPAPHPR